MASNHGFIFSRNRSDVEVIKLKIDLYTENSRQSSKTLLVYLMQEKVEKPCLPIEKRTSI